MNFNELHLGIVPAMLLSMNANTKQLTQTNVLEEIAEMMPDNATRSDVQQAFAAAPDSMRKACWTAVGEQACADALMEICEWVAFEHKLPAHLDREFQR